MLNPCHLDVMPATASKPSTFWAPLVRPIPRLTPFSCIQHKTHFKGPCYSCAGEMPLIYDKLSPQQEADGCNYSLSMQFDGQFELPSHLADSVYGLRCRMQAQISCQPSKQRAESSQTSKEKTINYPCCQRYHSFENGWKYWQHQSILKDSHGTCRTVCEKCARALYHDVGHIVV